MEGESKALLTAMSDCLTVSDSGRHSDGQTTTEPEEDSFFDCEETFNVEPMSLAGQAIMNHADVTHSAVPGQGADEGPHQDLQTDVHRCLADTDASEARAAKKRHRSLEGNALEDGTHEDQEKWEKVIDEEGNDSFSEFKEETIQKQEFDEDYLRGVEKDLTEEEKEVSIMSLSIIGYFMCECKCQLSQFVYFPCGEEKSSREVTLI